MKYWRTLDFQRSISPRKIVFQQKWNFTSFYKVKLSVTILEVLYSTYIIFTPTPMAEVINMTNESISKSSWITLSTAKYTNTPVTTQIMSTDVSAPITSALYQPNGIFFVAGLVAIHNANKDIIKLAKSVSRCAASVAIAKLLDM